MPLPAAARTRDASQRFQDRLAHLFRVEAEPGGVSFHDGDPGDEAFAALALFVGFFCKIAKAIRVEPLLDGSACKPHVLSLTLICGVDVPVQAVFVESGGADVKRWCHTPHI
jgi:hypothetical protein